MRNVVCPHCNGWIAVPEELPRAYCPLCGKEVRADETHVTAAPPPSSHAFRAETEAERGVANRERDPDQPPELYSTWDDFRLTSPAIQRELMKLATQAMPDLRMIERLPLPVETPAEIDHWGKPLASLSVQGDNQLVKRIGTAVVTSVGLLSSVTGILYLVAWKVFLGQAVVLQKGFGFLAVGTFFVILGVWIGLSRRESLSFTLWIFEEGLFMWRGGRPSVAPFEKIRDFKTTLETGQPLFLLTFKDESPVVLSIADCVELLPLMEYIEVRMAASQLLPRLKSIWLGKSEKFGVILLDREGLTGPGFFAPWSEVRRVMSDPRNLLVDWSKRPDWIDIRYRDVSFPHLVMAISHVMIDDHSRLAPVEA